MPPAREKVPSSTVSTIYQPTLSAIAEGIVQSFSKAGRPSFL
jgi:hypothetical protein